MGEGHGGVKNAGLGNKKQKFQCCWEHMTHRGSGKRSKMLKKEELNMNILSLRSRTRSKPQTPEGQTLELQGSQWDKIKSIKLR